MFLQYYREEKLFNWLKDHAFFTPDGISVSIMIFKRFFKLVRRYPGIEMVDDLLSTSRGYKIALIGAKPDTLKSACKYFKKRFFHHELVYYQDGYTDFDHASIHQLSAVSPDVILVAMGCPKQDLVLQQLQDLSHGVGIGVGGVFDVWAGKSYRVPLLFRLFGLEWLIRSVLEPRRAIIWFKAIRYLF